jgi:hypothetical protein
MATQGYGVDITLNNAASLSGLQFRAAKVDSNGLAALGGAGDFCVGITQDNVPTGEAGGVRISGVSKAVAGAAVAAGAKVTSDANGRIITATASTDNCLGVALSAAAALGEIISVLVLPGGNFVAD